MFGGSMYGSSMYGGGLGGGYYGSSGYGYGGGYGGMPMMGGLRNRQTFAMGGAGMMHEPLPPVPGTQHLQHQHAQLTTTSAAGAQEQGSSSNPPPSDETPAQKRRRMKHERHLAKQQAEERQLQRRTFMMSAAMELVSHAVQILMHSIRTCYELMSIAFGAYYSIKAMRAFLDNAKSSNGGGMVTEFQGANHTGSSSPVTRSPAAVTMPSSGTNSGGSSSPWGGRLRRVALAVALLSVAELVVTFWRQHKAHTDEAARRAHLGTVLRRDSIRGSSGVEYVDDDDEVTDDREELSETYSEVEEDEDEEKEDEDVQRDKGTATNKLSANPARKRASVHSTEAPQRRLFVARFDYETRPEDVDHLPFRAGDQLLVDSYAENDWCVATAVNSETGERRSGLIPGNYIRPITIPQKF